MDNSSKRVRYASEDSVVIDIPIEEARKVIINDKNCLLRCDSLVKDLDYPLFTSEKGGKYYIDGQDCILELKPGEGYYINEPVGEFGLYKIISYGKNIMYEQPLNNTKNIYHLDVSDNDTLDSFFWGDTDLSYIGYMKIGNPESLYDCFFYTSLTTVDHMDASQCDDISNLFGSTALKVLNRLDMKDGVVANSLFYNSNLTEIPDIEYHKISSAGSLFQFTPLVKVEDLNLCNATNTSELFYECSSLKTIGTIDISSSTNMESMFLRCSKLTSIDKIIGKPSIMKGAFDSCKLLQSIGYLDVSNLSTETDQMFYSCNALKYINLVSTDASKISLLASLLPEHSGAADNAYIIDISDNTQEIIDALTDLAATGWTIKRAK